MAVGVHTSNTSTTPSPMTYDPLSNRKIWILFLILALLAHFLAFMIQFDWAPSYSVAPKVEIQEIDPKKLEAIRRQWRQNKLLLDKNPSRPSEKTEPPDARYMSDKNIRVEKEQRARETEVIPKPKARPRPETRQKHPSLNKLALPFQLDSNPNSFTPARHSDPFQENSSSSLDLKGGDQALDEPNLPEGGENLLNTRESIYYSFYARLYEAIGPLWQSRTNEVLQRNSIRPGEYSTVVDIVLDEDGTLKEIRKMQGSGIEAFDTAVDETWRKVQRFPNPPQGLLNQERQVHVAWKFTVRVEQGYGLNFLPPQRSTLPR